MACDNRVVRLTWLPLLILALGAAGAQTVTSAHDPAPTRPKVRCNRTLAPGADVAKAVRAASGGATICLRGGNYGTIVASHLTKSPAVTVRAVPGTKPRIPGIELEDVSGLRFVSLHLTEGVSVSPSGSRLAFLRNDITGHRGIYFFGDYRIGLSISYVRIEGNEIHDLDYTGTQETGYGYGIEGVGDARHVVVADNTIRRVASDYIQSASPVNWLVNGNTFLGPSLLGSHADHQDLWQIFGGGTNVTFTNNVARGTQTQESLLFQEGASRTSVVTNNLFANDCRGYTCQIYQSSGLVFRRNTIVGSRWGCLFRDLSSDPPGSGYRSNATSSSRPATRPASLSRAGPTSGVTTPKTSPTTAPPGVPARCATGTPAGGTAPATAPGGCPTRPDTAAPASRRG